MRSRADDLRVAFDREFAHPHGAREVDADELLAIRIGGEPYALRRGDVTGLHAGKAITQLPSDVAGLLGIGGFRGTLLPVYDLRALLGGAGGAAPRWLVTVAAAPVALAFDGFEELVRVARDAAVKRSATVGHTRHAIQTASGLRPIVDVESILETIRARARSHKE